MVHIIKQDRIKEIYNELYNKNRVIAEFDFNKDIDAEKSDKFSINNEDGSLDFLYKEVRVLKPENYSRVHGEVKSTATGIELMPTFNDMTDNRVKRSHIITREGFKLSQVNSFRLDLSLEKKEIFYITISNKYSRDLYDRQSKNEIFLSGAEYDTPKRKTFMYQVGNKLIVRKYKGIAEIAKEIVPLYLSEKISFILNMSEGYIFQGNKKIRFTPVDFDPEEELYVSLVYNTDKSSDHQKKALVNSMSLLNDQGFIYFKPKKLQVISGRIIMVCIGTPIVQFYSDLNNEWVDLFDGQQLPINDLSLLRVKAVYGDKLLKLLLVEGGY